jgi:hypothetical protein
MAGFRPSDHYVRMMKEYGVIPRSLDADRQGLDPYEIDERYWRSFWHVPEIRDGD